MGAQEQISATEELIASQGAPVTDKPAAAAPVVDEVVTEEEPALGDEAGTSTDAQPSHGNKKPAKERISELTKNWRQEQRERQEADKQTEYWRQQALRQQPQQAAQPTPSQGEAEKTLEDFGYDQGRYLRYLAETMATQAIAKRDHEQAESAQREAVAKRVSTYQERIAQLEAANPDLDYETEVTNGPLPISDPMAEYIIESEVGPQMGLYFRDNPDEAKAIYALSPRAADRALAKIEAKLSAPAASDDSIPRPPAQITRAPPVPGQVGSLGAARKSGGSMDDEIAAVRALRNRRN